MSDPFELLSEDEKILVEESVLSYRKILSQKVINLRVRPDPVVLSDLNKDGEDNSIATEVSILTDNCAMCLEDTFESPNFKLVANCECSVTGCFECWSRWFSVNRNETVIKCPKCRRDISAFLLEQGFSPQPRQRLCSYCRTAGHNISTCSDRLYDEDNDRRILL
jgi:hypothetical protein